MSIRTLSAAALLAATAVAGQLFGSDAQAATTATAINALNIRSGPGPQYNVIGVINDKAQTTVTGCLQGSLWCQVIHNGKQGWAYSQYLTMDRSGQTVVIAREPSSVPVVTYQAPAGTVETVGAAPALAGTIVEPAGAPLVIQPPPAPVGSYVVSHPIDPTYLGGEVVVGAALPPSVALQAVPDYEYQYAYVNRMPVLVEPSSRRIVYIYR